jgi:hypothetical protein
MSAAPILFGMWDRVTKYVTSGATLFGCFTGFWSIVLFGYIREGNIATGMNYVFFKYYDWPSFVIPIIASTLGVGLWAAAENAIRRALNRPLPVLPALAAHSADDDQRDPAILGVDNGVCMEDTTVTECRRTEDVEATGCAGRYHLGIEDVESNKVDS